MLFPKYATNGMGKVAYVAQNVSYSTSIPFGEFAVFCCICCLNFHNWEFALSHSLCTSELNQSKNYTQPNIFLMEHDDTETLSENLPALQCMICWRN